MAASVGFTITDSDIERLIKTELGFDAVIELGPGGGYMFAVDILVEAGVTQAQLRAAAENGIRQFLEAYYVFGSGGVAVRMRRCIEQHKVVEGDPA